MYTQPNNNEIEFESIPKDYATQLRNMVLFVDANTDLPQNTKILENSRDIINNCSYSVMNKEPKASDLSSDISYSYLL